MLLIGSRGSGKSYQLTQMLTDKRMLGNQFDQIIIISPTMSFDVSWLESSIDFESSNIICYDEFTQEIVDELIDSQKAILNETGVESCPEILLILDDCISNDDTRKKDSGLRDLSYNGRHLKISLIMTSQKITSVITDIRSQYDSMLIFPMSSKRELQNLQMDCDISKELFKQHTMKQYSFLHFLREKGQIVIYNNDGEIIQE
jgi:hypothetical protein